LEKGFGSHGAFCRGNGVCTVDKAAGTLDVGKGCEGAGFSWNPYTFGPLDGKGVGVVEGGGGGGGGDD
jgi:hypothetical protein